MLVVIVICLFMALPAAYGSSQARNQIGVQLPAYATAMEILDLSHICDLCHSLNNAGSLTH